MPTGATVVANARRLANRPVKRRAVSLIKCVSKSANKRIQAYSECDKEFKGQRARLERFAY